MKNDQIIAFLSFIYQDNSEQTHMKKKKDTHKRKKIDLPAFKRPTSVNYNRDAKTKGLRNFLKRIKQDDQNDSGFLLLNNRYGRRPPIILCDVTHLMGTYTDPKTKLSVYDRHVLYHVTSLTMDRVKYISGLKTFGSSLPLFK